ncbi:MAG: membrane dipeptidase, partial [Bacteroidota bacterium]|nr:membrane dipeptidase [Bacteroidota bacterium]
MIKNLITALFLIVPFFLAIACAQTKAQQAAPEDSSSWRALHFNALVADGHNDVLTRVMHGADISVRTSDGQSDLVRMKEGGVDVQVFSVWMGPEYGEGKAFKYANEMIDSLESIVRRNPDKIAIAKTAEEARSIVKQKKIAAVIGVEGGHIIENNLHYLEALAKRGMRYLTLTWNNSTPWSTSGEDEALHSSSLTHKGLTGFGREVVRKLNQLGVMVDLAHVGEQTFYDALAVTSKPVIVSHSSVYALAPHYRNLKDDQIRALAKNGGVMCINFYPEFLDSTYAGKEKAVREKNKALEDSVRSVYHDPDRAGDVIDSLLAKQLNAIRPPLSLLIDHIDYVVKLVG